MMTPLTVEDREERGRALRAAFPDMPHGRTILFGALRDAAAPDDDAASDDDGAPAQPGAEHGDPD